MPIVSKRQSPTSSLVLKTAPKINSMTLSTTKQEADLGPHPKLSKRRRNQNRDSVFMVSFASDLVKLETNFLNFKVDTE